MTGEPTPIRCCSLPVGQGFASPWLGVVILLIGATAPAFADTVVVEAPGATTYDARDTLAPDADSSPAAQRVIDQIVWPKTTFQVEVAPAPGGFGAVRRLIRFPSPRPPKAGKPHPYDTVVLEWHEASLGDRTPRRSPALVLVHSIDHRLPVARAIARTICQQGVHAFVLHMPNYGLRANGLSVFEGKGFFDRCFQAVADTRRARDAIAVLPRVDGRRISIQGTSLGGFVATSAASLDSSFDHNFVVLAGGHLQEVFENGRREARWLRQSLERAGYRDGRLRAACDRIEPVHVAHRLDPKRTWLFSAFADQVVPAANARALAAAIGLDDSHHHWISGDHYTAVLNLPWMIRRMAQTIHGEADQSPQAVDR